MKYDNDSLKALKSKVRQEQQALRTGSPSDAEIGQAELADLASGYIPGLVEEVLDLREALDAATARATKAESRVVEVVQEILTEWRDNTLPDAGPDADSERRRLNHRVFFDIKCQQLTGRRLEPSGIYAGISAPLPSSPAAAPPLDRERVIEAMADLLTPEGEEYTDPLTIRLYGVRMAVNASVGMAAQKLGIYDELNCYYSGCGPATTTGEGKEGAPC